MKFIVAADSFKGSLSAQKFAEITEKEILDVFPGSTVLKLPMADGGEGTMEIVVDALSGKVIHTTAKDPLLNDMDARLGIVDGEKAIFEMAEVSGLTLVPNDKRNPLYTSTWGTGQLILKALDCGCSEIIICIGGSATNDGGIGAMGALGAKFIDSDGKELEPIAVNLEKIAKIDVSEMSEKIKDAKFRVMCDVTNPLTGEKGATYVFGPQKGADAEKLVQLEKGMKNYAVKLRETFGFDPDTPGAGAAGGLGAALKAFLGAELKSGVKTVLELYDFENKLEDTDIVITGEGRVDGQSADGKVLSGIGEMCLKKGVSAFAIAGGLGKGFESIYDCGIRSVIPTVSGIMDLDHAMENAEPLLKSAAQRALRLVKIGMNIK